MPANLSGGKPSPRRIYHKGWIDFNKNGRMDIFEDQSQPTERRVADLLSQMTVEEKTCQLATLYGYGRVLQDSLPTEGWKNEIWKDGIANIDEQLNGVGGRSRRNSPHLIYPFANHARAINRIQKWFIEETRLGIPVDFSNEAIHGLNHTKATPLPAPIGIGSTWNRGLVRQAGEIAGREAKALGYTNIYAPILDPARDPRWGRTVECYGEDPYLIAELGIEMVEGIQSQSVASTLKHFAVYSVPKGGRDGNARTDPHVAPRELHMLHLYPFRRVIEEAHPMGVMTSYNDWDGVPITASHYFLTELLRDTYGFDGYTVSDSDAVEFVHEKHRVAADYDDAVRQVLEAGLNVRTNFSQPSIFIEAARRLISDGKIAMEVIDRRVGEVLSVKFRLGLFDSPYVEDPDAADRIAGADKNTEFIDRMHYESLVLLKNEGGLLPLDKTTLKKVLVTGPLADESNFMVSRYGPNGLDNITILDGLRDYLGGEVEVAYAKGCDVRDANFPESEIFPQPMTAQEEAQIAEAVAAAADCDVVIAVMGEDVTLVGESLSRTGLDLPPRQNDLLRALHATGKPVVLVLINGQPLTINWPDKHIPAILEAWWPGCRGGRVIARTLFGEYNPGGKLTVTFPRTIGQIEYNFPFKPGSHGTQPQWSVNGGGVTRVTGLLYPFGHGLSYTSFEYSALEVTPTRQGADGVWTVRCRVANTGSRAGDEVVQLYVRDKVSSVTTYDSNLRGFERIHLRSGEAKTVEFRLAPADLQLIDRNWQWVVEPGEFEIMVGASSSDIRLMTTIEVTE
ncbi:glycoside hydrolase family 3 C-terminal domain-containing protein [Alistipes sp. OttesenSCG-928-B03]|nr:glycoside hydrolase family 3 C-terminal domain-containing protein [Alistipes sp. OttesenSCG-928-B03]